MTAIPAVTIKAIVGGAAASVVPKKAKDLTISFDGKTIRSTNRIEKIESLLHIISAQISELGLTLAQCSTDDKSNEIKAVQELLKTLNIKGNMVVADALKCPKETASIIVEQSYIVFVVYCFHAQSS